jgi:hypothetical protein
MKCLNLVETVAENNRERITTSKEEYAALQQASRVAVEKAMQP